MKKKMLLSLFTAVLLSLSFPPLALGFLAYFALIPFFLLLENLSYKESIRWGYLTGFFTNIGTLYWIGWVTPPGAFAAILYLPIYFIFYSVLHTFLRKRLGNKYLFICVPFLWTGMEFIRSLGVLGFPWNSLAYTQTYYLSLIQYVSFTSVYGVTFWIVTINVLILSLMKDVSNIKKVITHLILLILLFLFPWFYGQWVIHDEESDAKEKIRVGLIQGNVDPYLKWDDEFMDENLAIYDSLSNLLKKTQLDLIIWPETATPVYLRDSHKYKAAIRKLVDKQNICLITGTPDYKFLPDRSYLTYNAAFLFTPLTKTVEVYRKLHLVPFGEKVPFTETFPLLKDFLESLEMGQGNFSPGTEIVSFKVPLLKEKERFKSGSFLAPVLICFESMFSELARKFVKNGADILIIITNDAWFGRTSAPFHHAQAAIFRAIENRIGIARCANTGVSLFIDSFGKSTKSTSIFKKATLIQDMALRKESTFFTRYGHVFSITVTLLNILPIVIAFFSGNKV
ncbi:apolipoprotein N-acyltransferase [candidate division KSB1 bacterium]|nr:apolipoprotein N-acyltransferase [candidate division KSB1 bacterium]